MKHTVLFTRVSKEIRVCFGFALLRALSDWFKNLAPLSQPIRSKTKTNPRYAKRWRYWVDRHISLKFTVLVWESDGKYLSLKMNS